MIKLPNSRRSAAYPNMKYPCLDIQKSEQDIKRVEYVEYVEVHSTFFSRKIKQNKMSSSADNDIISLNFRNIIFALEVSKDKKVSDLENEKIEFFPTLTRRLMMRFVFTSE
ncbi:uncharacterized protein OCT59_026522 [Rhizophagus irregularis]|uniref:uncharacterized protein n=1 Tax=Rhizophagus irregularis TaxID=588596 RepID=UPI00332D9DE0|nr:hypothetical protein OCT59_026522 [Rhizophagus irregularis]